MTVSRKIVPTNLFEHEGRVGRTYFVIVFVGVFFTAIMSANLLYNFPMWLRGVALLLILVLYFAAMKRLHDFDCSGWHSVWLFVPIANLIFLCVLIFKAGSSGENQFGIRVKTRLVVPIVPEEDRLEARLRELKRLFEDGLLDEQAYRRGQEAAVERCPIK